MSEHPKDSTTLARLCTSDLGREILPDEVRAYLLSGRFPDRLDEDERLDMAATLLKAMSA